MQRLRGLGFLACAEALHEPYTVEAFREAFMSDVSRHEEVSNDALRTAASRP